MYSEHYVTLILWSIAWCVCVYVVVGSTVGPSVGRRLGNTTRWIHAWTWVSAVAALWLPARWQCNESVYTDSVASSHDQQRTVGVMCCVYTDVPWPPGGHSAYSWVLWTSQRGALLSSVWHVLRESSLRQGMWLCLILTTCLCIAVIMKEGDHCPLLSHSVM